ncbi:MAG: lipopolysaccharide biosynthesis protein RfbH [Candidatus Helarchaeota archaeon]
MNLEEIKNNIFSLLNQYYEKTFKNKKLSYIPVSGKKFDVQELISGVKAVLDGWWTEGSITKEFEKKFTQFLHIKHTIIVNSGSSANFLALKSLTSRKLNAKALKTGDEIITVAAGFPTTINPILDCNCIPVFCDVTLDTCNIDINQLEDALSPTTKAIFLAHTLGNPFNLDKVQQICSDYNLWLIEDCCDALGSLYKNKLVGTFGDFGTFSFYPAHQITMGEGGALVTDNDELKKIARSMRDWGRDCWCDTGKDNTCGKRFEWKLGELPYGYDHKYIYSEIGYNLKNTDLNVAIGLAQLDKLNDFIKQRRKNYELLFNKLKKYQDFFQFIKPTEHSIPSWFGFLITLKPNVPFQRVELLQYLNSKKIGTRLLFGGNITKQPYFIGNNIKYRIVKDLKNTDYLLNHSFWLGVCPLITKEDITFIGNQFGSFLEKYN